MKDITKARIWAISSIGYGRGDTIAEAVENHDEAQARNYGSMLAVPVAEIPLMVWEAPDGVTGFYADPAIHWTAGNEDRADADPATQIRAARNADRHWIEWAAETGLQYETL